MLGEFSADGSWGEQIDMELLLRRARVELTNRDGDDTCCGDPSAGKNALIFCARGSIKGACVTYGEWGVRGDVGRKDGEVGVVGCMLNKSGMNQMN